MAQEVEVVHYERDGKVGVITLDRPPHNAYTRVMEDQLIEAWQTAANDDSGAILLQANGRNFCAGADVAQEDEGGSRDVNRSFRSAYLYQFCRNVTKPTVVAVQGGCIAGGQRFVWPCDLIFASEDAYFSDPTVDFGIGGIPLHGHPWEYGPRLAKEMLFLGNRLPAERLYQMGMVNRMLPREELRADALDAARQIAEKPVAAVRNAKRVVNTTLDIMGQHYIANRFFELVDDLPVTQIGRRSSTDRWDSEAGNR